MRRGVERVRSFSRICVYPPSRRQHGDAYRRRTPPHHGDGGDTWRPCWFLTHTLSLARSLPEDLEEKGGAKDMARADKYRLTQEAGERADTALQRQAQDAAAIQRSAAQVHKTLFEGYPMCGLGAVGVLLEPFCGHSSPKVDEIFNT